MRDTNTTRRTPQRRPLMLTSPAVVERAGHTNTRLAEPAYRVHHRSPAHPELPLHRRHQPEPIQPQTSTPNPRSSPTICGLLPQQASSPTKCREATDPNHRFTSPRPPPNATSNLTPSRQPAYRTPTPSQHANNHLPVNLTAQSRAEPLPHAAHTRQARYGRNRG